MVDQIKKPYSAFAIAGFIVAFFLPPLGLVFSIIALATMKSRSQTGKGLAIAGTIISAFLCVFSVVVFLLWLFMPGPPAPPPYPA
ncbi:MAG: DUF4190 domain-containing protein [Coriobacteriia bacterium]|nr:DUF4190 domain-containing protein [Coriobacteriia bacterium]